MLRRAAVGLTLLLLVAAPAYATMITYHASLTGSQETPPNASPATGNASLTLDDALLTLQVQETFTGLIGGPAVAAHIHCCAPPGVAAAVAVPFGGFPGATSGTYNQTFDLTLSSTYTASFLAASGGLAGAEAALTAAFNNGNSYVNIHDAQFPGGEIRGQIQAPVPEPATVTLIGTGIAALLARKRRRNPLS